MYHVEYSYDMFKKLEEMRQAEHDSEVVAEEVQEPKKTLFNESIPPENNDVSNASTVLLDQNIEALRNKIKETFKTIEEDLILKPSEKSEASMLK